jgi:hypothetical protein
MFNGAPGNMGNGISDGAGPIFWDNKRVGVKTNSASYNIAQVLRVLHPIEGAQKGVLVGFQILQEIIGIDIGELVPFKTDMGSDAFEFIDKRIFWEDTELNTCCFCLSDAFI